MMKFYHGFMLSQNAIEVLESAGLTIGGITADVEFLCKNGVTRDSLTELFHKRNDGCTNEETRNAWVDYAFAIGVRAMSEISKPLRNPLRMN